MDKREKAIRWSAVAAVALLAAVAGWVSYTHALDVVRAYGQQGYVAYAYPATTDGMIYVSSMVLLDAAWRRIRSHWLAWTTLVLGILITGAVNAWSGLAWGPIGAVISAWPAAALVLGYELLMLLIRNAQKRPETQETQVLSGTLSINEIREREGFPPFPAMGFGGIDPESAPSIRSIMKSDRVGFDKAKERREALLNGQNHQ
jgi:hypothetical protein